ncbi:MAG: hydroxyacylglutathione hydrolase [Thiomonas sp.]|uniref:hydroxyacylglutathione hydrolase n=1 Tax=mine drainage metagenome TaxID=410659 RepID=E6PMY6_9ZZZZ
MHIVALPAFRDNYIWMIHDTHRALVVDPGDAGPVEAACKAQGLELAGILVTHHHADHTGGIVDLLRARQLPVWGPAAETIPGMTHPLHDGDRIAPPGFHLEFEILQVPGHTLGHIAYFADGGPGKRLLFCGDTLFSAGCGRLFEGTPSQMLHSLDRLSSLPADSRVFCTHEYTLGNLQFARHVEPGNTAMQDYTQWCLRQRAEHQPTLPSTLERELHVNPFLRVSEPEVQAQLTAHAGHKPADRIEAFTLMRQWKNDF